MGLFDFFKKKENKEKNAAVEPVEKAVEALAVKEQTTQTHETASDVRKSEPLDTEERVDSSQMSLTELFEQAFKNPALRLDFYKRLAEEELIILTTEGKKMDNSDEVKWEILTFKEGEIPLFTSKEKMMEKGVVSENQPHLSLKLAQIFSATKGAKYWLNPFSQVNKVLTEGEVEHCITGKIAESVNVASKSGSFPQRVRLSIPSYCPQEMVDAIKAKLVEFPSVKEVYIAYMENAEDPNDVPRYVLGVHGGLNAEIAQAIGKTVAPFLKGKGDLNIMPIGNENENGLDAYFFSTKPIYTNPACS